MVEAGVRYTSPYGVQLIVTKSGSGVLSDGATPLMPGRTPRLPGSVAPPIDAPRLEVGARYRSPDGTAEVLVIKPGECDLMYDGRPMRRFDAGPGSQAAGVPRRPSPGDRSMHAGAPLDDAPDGATQVEV